MKKLNVRFTRRRVIFAVVLLLLAGLIAVSGYYFMQFKGLKNRVSQLENNFSSFSTDVYFDETLMEGYGNVEYEVLSVVDKDVRVQDIEAYSYKTNPEGDIPYKTIKAKEIKLRINNKGDMVHTFDGISISAQTKEGVLIPGETIHPEDQAGESSLTLAPGGAAEGVLYVNTDGKEIVNLFDTINNVKIDLN